MRLLVLLAALAATSCTNEYGETWNPIADSWWVNGVFFTSVLLFSTLYPVLKNRYRVVVPFMASLLVATLIYSLGLMHWEYDVITSVAAAIAFLARGMHKWLKKPYTPLYLVRQASEVMRPEASVISYPSGHCSRCNQITLGATVCITCGGSKGRGSQPAQATQSLDDWNPN